MLRFDPTPCPLILGADGAIRVKGSSVMLELIAGAFEAGATPEQIAHHCPSLSLATIYSVISQLLSQPAEVELYLQKRAAYVRLLTA